MKIIFLIIIGLSSLNAEDVIIDSKEKLQWQNDKIGNIMNWQESISHCESLTLNGYKDWRLPNINELSSLIDDTKYNPSISDVFTNTALSSYWSATTHFTFNDSAMFVSFEDGSVNGFNKVIKLYVRCVRNYNPQPPL